MGATSRWVILGTELDFVCLDLPKRASKPNLTFVNVILPHHFSHKVVIEREHIFHALSLKLGPAFAGPFVYQAGRQDEVICFLMIPILLQSAPHSSFSSPNQRLMV